MLFSSVAQPEAVFLLLKLLSGKVKLTGLRTTGSDGDERRAAESRETDTEGWESTLQRDDIVSCGSKVREGMKQAVDIKGTKETLVIRVKVPLTLSGTLISHCV